MLRRRRRSSWSSGEETKRSAKEKEGGREDATNDFPTPVAERREAPAPMEWMAFETEKRVEETEGSEEVDSKKRKDRLTTSLILERIER